MGIKLSAELAQKQEEIIKKVMNDLKEAGCQFIISFKFDGVKLEGGDEECVNGAIINCNRNVVEGLLDRISMAVLGGNNNE